MGDFAYDGNFELTIYSVEAFLRFKMTPYSLKLINIVRFYKLNIAVMLKISFVVVLIFLAAAFIYFLKKIFD